MDRSEDAPDNRLAESAADYEAFGEVCRAYFAWCRARYAEMPWFVDEVFGQQSFDEELKVLAAKYGPPAGRTMLAVRDGQVVAGGAYHRLADGVCELKRLYVTDEARGLVHLLGEQVSALAQQVEQFAEERYGDARELAGNVAGAGAEVAARAGRQTAATVNAIRRDPLPALVALGILGLLLALVLGRSGQR